MRTRTVLVLAIVVFAACGTTPPRPSSQPDRRDAPPAVTLVQTVHGIAGVTRGTDTIRWQIDGAVAAVDGSAVFTRTIAGELARLARPDDGRDHRPLAHGARPRSSARRSGRPPCPGERPPTRLRLRA